MTEPGERSTAGPTRGPALLVARGARAAEARVLRELAAHAAAARAEPRLLARPVRIVVPSRSLREHLAAAIARELGSVAGIVVQTLQALAREVLERAGAGQCDGDDLFPILVRAEAALLPALRGALGELEDGYASVLGAVADFLDAGLTPDLAPAVARRIADLPTDLVGDGERERAIALVEVAARVHRALRARGLARRSDRLAGAAAEIERAADHALPARAVLIHGFADATGVALELIERLCRAREAVVVLDQPPDPAQGGDGGASERFTQRLFERVRGAAVLVEDGPDREQDGASAREPAMERPQPALLDAVGADAEVRGAAERVHALLDAAPELAPERIGIVARHLDMYAVPLRRHLGRLALPFSSNARGPAGALARRLHALLRLLREGGSAPVDAWLDAAGLAPGLRADLRVAFHWLGAGRLADAARLDLKAVLGDDASLALPVRRGLASGEGAKDPAAGAPRDAASPDTATPEAAASRRSYAGRRHVSRTQLEQAVGAAAELEAALASGERVSLAQHVATLRRRIAPRLGLRPGDPARFRGSAGAGPLLHLELAAIERTLPAEERLDREEWLWLLEQRLERRAAEALGGAGAGVQVLDVVAARARTFEHLFVLGLNRDVFPRTVSADALLPDALRAALRDVLPDLPVKEEGYDEERHLFAQLLSSSARVTLLWQVAGDDGKARSPSPLVERLRWGRAELAPERLPGLYAPRALAAPRPAVEHAILAGLHGGPRALAPLLASTLTETAGDAPAALVAARLAVLRELDRFGVGTESLGPYFGYVGEVVDRDDPRRRTLHATSAERIAVCGWQHLLEKILGVEAMPDALSSLPAVEAWLLGSVVHRALDRLARESGAVAERLEDALAGEGVAPRWPDTAALHGLALAAAHDVLREQQGPLVLPGFARAVAARAVRSLGLAAQADAETGARLLGSELVGVCTVSDGAASRALHFRADRAERQGETVVVTDFKTGSPPKPWSLKHVARGSHLQAVAYSLAAAAASGRPAVGRYLYLRPNDEAAAEIQVSSDDARAAAAFARALSVVTAAREAGSLLPRLVDASGEEPKTCERCDLAEACLRGDSGLRARLRRWALAREKGAQPGDSAAERAWRDLWWLAEEEAG